MTTVTESLKEILASLPAVPPVWLQPGAGEAPTDPAAAAQTLSNMDPVDRNLCVLVYGFGLPLGSVSYALRLDPAVAAWHLERALENSAQTPTLRAAFEASLVSLLREPHTGLPTPLDGAASWLARDMVPQFASNTRERLQARLVRDEHDLLQRRSHSGLGVGVLFALGAGFLFFLIYGAVLDQNPMWRGREMLRRGQSEKARESFLQLGNLPEAQRWAAIAWLAEGEFKEAARIIRRQETRWPNDFRPFEPPFPGEANPLSSRAMLPRGLEMDPRPEFVYTVGGPGSLEVFSEASGRGLRHPLDPALVEGELVRLRYPEGWPKLPAGIVTWTVPGLPGEPPQQTNFELLSPDERTRINTELINDLHLLPPAARLYMRGHYFLRYGLYVRASHQFAELAQQFPEQQHPLRMLKAIGQALGVDSDVLLR